MLILSQSDSKFMKAAKLGLIAKSAEGNVGVMFNRNVLNLRIFAFVRTIQRKFRKHLQMKRLRENVNF